MTQAELLAHMRAAFNSGKRSSIPSKVLRGQVARAVIHCEAMDHDPVQTWKHLVGIVPEASTEEIVYLLRRAHPGMTEAGARAAIDEGLAAARDVQSVFDQMLGAATLEASSPHPPDTEDDTPSEVWVKEDPDSE